MDLCGCGDCFVYALAEMDTWMLMRLGNRPEADIPKAKKEVPQDSDTSWHTAI